MNLLLSGEHTTGWSIPLAVVHYPSKTADSLRPFCSVATEPRSSQLNDENEDFEEGMSVFILFVLLIDTNGPYTGSGAVNRFRRWFFGDSVPLRSSRTI